MKQIMRFKLVATYFFLFAFVSTAHATSEEIHESDFGKEWPFTVPDGVLRCSGANDVTFISQGTEYAVNASAQSKYANIDPIWKFDMPRNEEMAKAMVEAFNMTIEEAREENKSKINIGPIIDAGLALCGS